MIWKCYLFIALIIFLFLIYDLNKQDLFGVIEVLIAFVVAILWLPLIIILFLKESL